MKQLIAILVFTSCAYAYTGLDLLHAEDERASGVVTTTTTTPKPLMASDMTMRDVFAAAILMGVYKPSDKELTAKTAYDYADAMLKQREKSQ